MYSRFPHQERPMQIPEHYSGCAFSPSKQTPHPAPHVPTPPPLPPPEAEKPMKHTASCECKKEEKPIDCGIVDALRHTFGGAFSGFPAGMEFEEFLLIGLILLLARSEQENDMILWLALLLLGK